MARAWFYLPPSYPPTLLRISVPRPFLPLIIFRRRRAYHAGTLARDDTCARPSSTIEIHYRHTNWPWADAVSHLVCPIPPDRRRTQRRLACLPYRTVHLALAFTTYAPLAFYLMVGRRYMRRSVLLCPTLPATAFALPFTLRGARLRALLPPYPPPPHPTLPVGLEHGRATPGGLLACFSLQPTCATPATDRTFSNGRLTGQFGGGGEAADGKDGGIFSRTRNNVLCRGALLLPSTHAPSPHLPLLFHRRTHHASAHTAARRKQLPHMPCTPTCILFPTLARQGTAPLPLAAYALDVRAVNKAYGTCTSPPTEPPPATCHLLLFRETSAHLRRDGKTTAATRYTISACSNMSSSFTCQRTFSGFHAADGVSRRTWATLPRLGRLRVHTTGRCLRWTLCLPPPQHASV